MKITVKINDTNYDVEVGDINARPIQATLNGESFEVWPEESTKEVTPSTVAKPAETPKAAVVRSAAPVQPSGDVSKAIIAPIPGVIISISAKVGDTISVGQEVCILEAMKMKNSIKSTRTGKINAIKINTGDHVQHGQTLFEFAD